MATTSIHCKHGRLSCVIYLNLDEFRSQNIAPAVHRAARLIAYLNPRQEVQYDGGEGGYSEWIFGDWSRQTIEVIEMEDDFTPPTRSQLRGKFV